MEFRNLYTFLRAAELGSFTKTADDLGYAQSTVTIQIQQLETDIGVPLFDRIGKKVYLTPQGQELIGYANQILHLEQKIKGIRNLEACDLHGRIRIGIVESIMNSVFLSVVREYQNRYPNIFIQVIPGISSTLFELLRHNEVDLIFSLGAMTNYKEFIRVASHQEQAVFVAAPDHPLAQKKNVSVSEIFDYPLILNGETAFLQQELHKLATQSGKEIISHIQSESSSIIINLTQQNLGIAFQAEYLVRSACDRQELSILPVENFSFPFYMHIFYHQNKWITPQMVGLVQLVQDYWDAQQMT